MAVPKRRAEEGASDASLRVARPAARGGQKALSALREALSQENDVSSD